MKIRKRCLLVLVILSIISAGVQTVSAQDAVYYEDLGMVLMLPTLDINADIVLSPWIDNNWDVYGLEDRVGLLEGAAMPGEGFCILAGHNHLSASRSGPFLFIRDMEINDVIFITDDAGMMRFRVYANELLDADDGARLAEIARREANSLVLLTCENETPEGTYANRRAVFAKPIY